LEALRRRHVREKEQTEERREKPEELKGEKRGGWNRKISCLIHLQRTTECCRCEFTGRSLDGGRRREREREGLLAIRRPDLAEKAAAIRQGSCSQWGAPAKKNQVNEAQNQKTGRKRYFQQEELGGLRGGGGYSLPESGKGVGLIWSVGKGGGKNRWRRISKKQKKKTEKGGKKIDMIKGVTTPSEKRKTFWDASNHDPSIV